MAGTARSGNARREGGRLGRTGHRAPLVGGACVALLAQSAGALEPLPDASYLQWSGVLDARTLDDDSVLSRYVARTDAPETPGAALSIGFVPRFDCTPLIGVRLEGSGADGSALGDGTQVALAIDGDGSDIVVLVDTDGSATTLWVDAEAEGRRRLRRLIDTGSRAELSLPDETSVAFSLLGSRRSAAAAEAACRTHEPVPYEPD